MAGSKQSTSVSSPKKSPPVRTAINNINFHLHIINSKSNSRLENRSWWYLLGYGDHRLISSRDEDEAKELRKLFSSSWVHIHLLTMSFSPINNSPGPFLSLNDLQTPMGRGLGDDQNRSLLENPSLATPLKRRRTSSADGTREAQQGFFHVKDAQNRLNNPRLQQLITPSASTKLSPLKTQGPFKRADTTTFHKSEPLPSSSITSEAHEQLQDGVQAPWKQVGSTQYGWYTTEDIVKNGLSKTTLEKLSAFRYTGPPKTDIEASVTPLSVRPDYYNKVQIPDIGGHSSREVEHDITEFANSILEEGELRRPGCQESLEPLPIIAQKAVNATSSDRTDNGEICKVFARSELRRPDCVIASSEDSFDEGLADEDFDAVDFLAAPCQESFGQEVDLSVTTISSVENIHISEPAENEMVLENTEMVEETFEPPTSPPYVSDRDSKEREIYDQSLQFSRPSSALSGLISSQVVEQAADIAGGPIDKTICPAVHNIEDWTFLTHEDIPKSTIATSGRAYTRVQQIALLSTSTVKPPGCLSADPLALKPFVRPKYPSKIQDRSPILGTSSNMLLRTCFRIGEALQIGGECGRTKEDAIVELFARVTFSSREEGTVKQHFQFADLFHERPPFLNGVLANHKVYALQETESRRLLGSDGIGRQIRCIGRIRWEVQGTGYLMHILSIRGADWEEIRYTKSIAGAGMVKSQVIYREDTES